MQTIQEKLTACKDSPDDSIVSVTLGELRALASLRSNVQAAITDVEAKREQAEKWERGNVAITGALLRSAAFENEIRGALVASDP